MYSRRLMILAPESLVKDVRLLWNEIDNLHPDKYLIIFHNKNVTPHYHIYLHFKQPISTDDISKKLFIGFADFIVNANVDEFVAARYFLQLDRPPEYQYHLCDLRTNIDLRSIPNKLCI